MVHEAHDNVAPDWLAVDVSRTINTDSDRLSHPLGIERVVADAQAAGLTVVRARIPPESWRLLETATHLCLANERNLAAASDAADIREGNAAPRRVRDPKHAHAT